MRRRCSTSDVRPARRNRRVVGSVAPLHFSVGSKRHVLQSVERLRANCASPRRQGDDLWRSRGGRSRFQRAIAARLRGLYRLGDRLGAAAGGHATSEGHDMADPVPRQPLCRAAAAWRAACWVHVPTRKVGEEFKRLERSTARSSTTRRWLQGCRALFLHTTIHSCRVDDHA